VIVRRAQSTRAHIGVYRCEQAGLVGDEWATVCEDHGRMMTHTTLADAHYHAPMPEQWCADCRAHFKRKQGAL